MTAPSFSGDGDAPFNLVVDNPVMMGGERGLAETDAWDILDLEEHLRQVSRTSNVLSLQKHSNTQQLIKLKDVWYITTGSSP